jgi:glycosyltransferase involved in cell wall biosynthesis
MKICVIGPSKKFFSGLSAYTIGLANAFSKDNDVSVILLRNLVPKFFYPGKEHVGKEDESLYLHNDIPVFDGIDWNSPLTWIKALRFLNNYHPDVIIMLWWSCSVAHTQFQIALWNRLKVKASLILDMHEIVDPLEENMPLIRLYSKIMGKMLMKNVDFFVVHSKAVKAEAVKRYHLQNSSVFVIPHALYENYYQHYDKAKAQADIGVNEDYVILYFGMIRKYKGVTHLVKAFDILPREVIKNSRLIIAGEDWKDDPSLNDAINSSPYKHKITYNPQFVPHHMVAKYFTASDVIVLPYLRTSGSGVANIAMAYGKPIITSNLNTMKECLREYEGAFFAPPGDPRTIAKHILTIYNKRVSEQEMTYDRPKHTWDAVVKDYRQIITNSTSSNN